MAHPEERLSELTHKSPPDALSPDGRVKVEAVDLVFVPKVRGTRWAAADEFDDLSVGIHGNNDRFRFGSLQGDPPFRRSSGRSGLELPQVPFGRNPLIGSLLAFEMDEGDLFRVR